MSELLPLSTADTIRVSDKELTQRARDLVRDVVPPTVLDSIPSSTSTSDYILKISTFKLLPSDTRGYKYHFETKPSPVLPEVGLCARGSLVVFQVSCPLEMSWGHAMSQYAVPMVVAGVIDEVSSNSCIRFSRGICVKPRWVKTSSDGLQNPLTFFKDGVPQAVINAATILDVYGIGQAFAEKQLYLYLQELAQENQGYELLSTDPSLLEMADVVGLQRAKEFLDAALNGGIDLEIEGRRLAMLEQVEQLKRAIGDLPQVREQELAQARFQRDLIVALEKRAVRVLDLRRETDEQRVDLITLISTSGFNPELIHPYFFPYVQSVVLFLAEHKLVETKDATITALRNMSAEDALALFPIPNYGEKIYTTEAIFMRNPDRLFDLCGGDTDLRKKLFKKFKNAYIRSFHPEAASLDKDLAAKLFKAGFSIIDDYTSRYGTGK